MNQQHIVISSGDINGIGPEIILKTFAGIKPDSNFEGFYSGNHNKNNNDITVTILSSREVMDYYCSTLHIDPPYRVVHSVDEARAGAVNLLESYEQPAMAAEPGVLSPQAGACAMQAVERGIELCVNGKADALVTAPISKEAVNLAGYRIPGHTEFLAERTDTSNFLMMLVSDSLRVGLASVHIPIVSVPGALTVRSIVSRAEVMHESLIKDFGTARPRIAVLGLNPHAGDGGIIGGEEMEIIGPAIQIIRDNGINATGPHAADGFFGNKKYEQCDAILAMYHDQGLVPFKALSFGAGVNFTAGLPIVRTSPDHGTAFDIAGQGKANPSSFRRALQLASQVSYNRKQTV